MATIVFKIKRRSTGGTGAPTALAQGELAYNETDDTLWIGKGTTPVPYALGGLGNFMSLSSSQTVTSGTKTFAVGSTLDASAATAMLVPTVAFAAAGSSAASLTWVKAYMQPLNTLLTSISGIGLGILVQSAAGTAYAATLTGTSGRVTVTNGSGAGGTNPTIDLSAVSGQTGTPGTAYTKITFDTYGRVTAGTTITAGDLSGLNLAFTNAATTFTAGLSSSAAISQYSNNTTVATTAWVQAVGLGVTPTITNYTTTPQTLTAAQGGSFIRYTGTANATFTLPLCSTIGVAGTMNVISNQSTYMLTLSLSGSDTTTEANLVLNPGERIGLISDAVSAWHTAWRTNMTVGTFSGTVTAATLTTGANFSVGTAGAISAVSLNLSGSIAQAYVYAAPSGAAGAPTFRALVSTDLPTAGSTSANLGVAWFSTGLTVTGGAVTANVYSVAGLTGASAASATTLAAALTTLAPLASPTFTGVPAAPTAANGTNTTQLATTAYVLAVRHDQLQPPTSASSVNWNSSWITNLANPVNPQDAATKYYVDNTLQGLQTKPTATVATTAPLPTNTYSNGASGVGATLTATITGILTVDSRALVLNDIVLVRNEATQANNGLYTVTTAGTAFVAYVLTRHIDMNTPLEFPGAFIPIEFGTLNGNTLWLCNPSGTVTVGTTAITFTQLNGATSLVAGNSISISGNTISVTGTTNRIITTGGGVDISASYVGQTSLTTLGTIGTGTWNATVISTQYGGTGQNFSGSSGLILLTTGVASAVSTIPYANLPFQSGVSATVNTAGGFGNMAAQNSTAVAITGGTIDGITLDAGTF